MHGIDIQGAIIILDEAHNIVNELSLFDSSVIMFLIRREFVKTPLLLI